MGCPLKQPKKRERTRAPFSNIWSVKSGADWLIVIVSNDHNRTNDGCDNGNTNQHIATGKVALAIE